MTTITLPTRKTRVYSATTIPTISLVLILIWIGSLVCLHKSTEAPTILTTSSSRRSNLGIDAQAIPKEDERILENKLGNVKAKAKSMDSTSAPVATKKQKPSFISPTETQSASKIPSENKQIQIEQPKSEQEPKVAKKKKTKNFEFDPNKPFMIVHIGPSKTATSTIQRDSVNYLENPLAQDGYVYVGKFAQGNARKNIKVPMLFEKDDCFQQAAAVNFTQTPELPDCWHERMAGILKLAKKNTSFVFSDEAYSYRPRYQGKYDAEYYQNLRLAFQDHFNILIIPVYRRYAEWVLSAIKEQNRRGCLWNGQWPNQPKGKPCHNLWKKIQELLRYESFGTGSYSNLDITLASWRDYGGFNVSILNYHDLKKQDNKQQEERQQNWHISCYFYCNMIPNTPHTCQYCQKSVPTSIQNSQSPAMTAYDDIIFEAARRKVLDTSKYESRQQAAIQLANHHQQTLHKRGLCDLPHLQCPSRPELERLLSKSLALERMVLDHDNEDEDDEAATIMARKEREQHHRDAFWRMAEEQRQFCWVDAKALLKEKKSWDQVLEALKSTSTPEPLQQS